MKLFGFLFLALLSVSALGKVTHPSLFRVTRPETTTPASYLFGTLHTEVEISEFEIALPQLIQSSRLVMTEIALSKEEANSYLLDPYKALWQHDPQPIGNLAASERLALQSLGMPEWMTYRVQNESCSIFAVLHSVASKKLPLDVAIMQIAHKAQVPLRALDTSALRHEAKTLHRRSQKGPLLKCRLDLLLAQESPDAILRLFADHIQISANKYREGQDVGAGNPRGPLLTFRNKAWLKAILPEARRGNLFVAVGQSHLFGPEGLIELLKARGFSIERVTDK